MIVLPEEPDKEKLSICDRDYEKMSIELNF